MTDWNRPQPAPRALWTVIQANIPKARNVGIFVRRNIAGTSTPSLHSEGRALDIGLNASDSAEVVIGDRLFQIFCELGRTLQLEEVILATTNLELAPPDRSRLHRPESAH